MPKGEKLPLYNKETRYRPLEDIAGEKMHKKTFAVKLPVAAAEKLLKLDTKERTLLIRRAVLKELENSS